MSVRRKGYRNAGTDPACGFEGCNVLVTGGMGFIGSNLALRLAGAGAHVTVIDSMEQGCGSSRANILGGDRQIRVLEEGIGDTERFAGELSGFGTIFNVAGELSHARSMPDPGGELPLPVDAIFSLPGLALA